MKQVHKAIRFEDSRGWMELRFFPNDETINSFAYVTGHWKAWDGKTYHNTAQIVERDGSLNKSELDELIRYALGSDSEDKDTLKAQCLEVIGKEFDVSRIHEC